MGPRFQTAAPVNPARAPRRPRGRRYRMDTASSPAYRSAYAWQGGCGSAPRSRDFERNALSMTAISSGMSQLAQKLSIAAAIALIGCSGPEAESPKSGGSNPLVGSPAPEFEAEKITGDGPASLKD